MEGSESLEWLAEILQQSRTLPDQRMSCSATRFGQHGDRPPDCHGDTTALMKMEPQWMEILNFSLLLRLTCLTGRSCWKSLPTSTDRGSLLAHRCCVQTTHWHTQTADQSAQCSGQVTHSSPCLASLRSYFYCQLAPPWEVTQVWMTFSCDVDFCHCVFPLHSSYNFLGTMTPCLHFYDMILGLQLQSGPLDSCWNVVQALIAQLQSAGEDSLTSSLIQCRRRKTRTGTGFWISYREIQVGLEIQRD